MKFKFIFFYVSLLFFNCKSQESEISLPLVFKSPKGGVFDFVKYKGNYSLNEVLILNQDSTYVYRMCAQLEKGKWKFRNDTLMLFCENRKFHNDSINYLEKYKEGTVCPELPNLWIKKKAKIENVYDKYVLLED